MKILALFLLLCPLHSYCQLSSVALVKDIYVGRKSSYPVQALKLNNTTVIFFAEDEFYGRELWKSDGTPGGTLLVKDISVGTSSSIGEENFSMDLFGNKPIVHNGIYYFLADDGIHGYEVWRSDGTEVGTYPLTNSAFSASPVPPSFAVYNGQVYFWATSDEYGGGAVLYKTAGTSNTTTVIRRFRCGHTLPLMTIYNNLLYFVAADEVPGCEFVGFSAFSFWKTDGSSGGTTKAFGSFNRPVVQVGIANNLIFFTVSGSGLYKSNGTETGTTLVRQIGSNFSLSSGKILESNGLAYFRASQDSKDKLWRTDGTLQGTFSITSHGIEDDRFFIKYQNSIYFIGYVSSTSRWQLMKSDGTVAGTQTITNLPDNVYSPLCVIDNYIHLISGYSIWRTDGTAQNLYKIIQTETNYDRIIIKPVNLSDGMNLVKIGNKVLFVGEEFFTSFPGPTRYGIELRAAIDNGICNDQISVKSGNWNDPTVWSCGTVPTLNQSVTIKTGHILLLTNNMGPQQCKKITFETGAVFQNSGNLLLAQP